MYVVFTMYRLYIVCTIFAIVDDTVQKKFKPAPIVGGQVKRRSSVEICTVKLVSIRLGAFKLGGHAVLYSKWMGVRAATERWNF